MRFKLDENIPRAVAEALRAAAHDADTALDEALGGGSDARLMDACRRERRVLVTLDLDFADIRLYPPAGHAGIWVLRPPLQNVQALLDAISGALALLSSEPADRRLWIIERDRVRVRE